MLRDGLSVNEIASRLAMAMVVNYFWVVGNARVRKCCGVIGYIDLAVSIGDLRVPPSNRFRELKGEKNMSIPDTRKRNIRPTHPGEMLREDFLPEYGLNTSTLARELGVSRQTVNELLRERPAVSPEMAIRLSRFFGNSPEFWLNAQRAVDLWDVSCTLGKTVLQIRPVHTL